MHQEYVSAAGEQLGRTIAAKGTHVVAGRERRVRWIKEGDPGQTLMVAVEGREDIDGHLLTQVVEIPGRQRPTRP